MMGIPFTLSVYFGRNFAGAVAIMLAALSGLVALFDFLELLRESATAPAASFGIIVEMELLRLPWTLLQILPFAVWRLARSSELVVARAAGISAWQFLAVPVLLAGLFGAFGTGAMSPLSALFYGRAEQLYNNYLKPGGGPLSLNGGQLWVRQADDGISPGGVAVLHAQGVLLRDNVLRANGVTILRLNDQPMLLRSSLRRHHPGRGRARHAQPRRLGFANGPHARTGRAAARDRGAKLPHGPHRASRAGEFRLARFSLLLGAAQFHRAPETVRLLADPA